MIVEKTYQILTNQTCNLRCGYCYESMNGKVNDIDTSVSFIKACFEQDKGKGYHAVIDFIGGEPFLVVKLLKAVSEFVRDNISKYGFHSFNLSISTNATLTKNRLVREYIEEFKDYLYIGISIDGKKDLHDKNRPTATNRGSFNDALSGYHWITSVLGRDRVNIKATFHVDQIPVYADNVKYLMSLNPRKLDANFVFEESFTHDDGVNLIEQYMDIIDYYVDNNLNLEFDKIIYKDKSVYSTGIHPKRRLDLSLRNNSCGTVTHMKALGFDKGIFGCNRFATSDKSGEHKIADFDDKNLIFITNSNKVVEESINQTSHLSDECKRCSFNNQCGMCIALPVELGCKTRDDFKQFYNKRRHCYYTKAKEVAKRYYNGIIRVR